MSCLRVGGLALAATVFCLGGALAPSAGATVSHISEAPYTKGTTNTWWFSWADPASAYYYVSFTMYRNNQAVMTETTGYLAGGNGAGSTASGTVYDNQSGLASGSTYDMCATEYYTAPGSGLPPMPHMSDCVTSTMDAATPAAYASVDGTATYTNNPVMNLQINYSESVAPPWPGGSTFDCWRKNSNTTSTGCQNAPGGVNQFQFDSGCSAPSSYLLQATATLQCTYDISSLSGFSDGTWYYCVREADYAIPDSGTGSTNDFSATSDMANLSPDTPSHCGYITLDRTPPTVSPTPSATTVTVGQLVNFSVQASDNLSGVSSQYTWSFGDNTATATGANPSHTYTQVGTYQTTVTTTDGAGNTGTGHVTITVNPAGGSGGTPGNTASPVISGTPRAGEKLSTTNGSWTGNPTSFGYQWQDCDTAGASCVNINGATANTRLLTQADVGHTLRVVVTAINGSGSTQATSAQTATIAAAPAGLPANTTLPVISGSGSVGSTLSTTNGSWTGAPTSFDYQWQDCDTAGVSCVNINGATASTHLLAATDVGHTLRVTVTATNGVGSVAATSAPTATVTGGRPAPIMHGVQLLSSSFTAKKGTTLTLTLSGSATINVRVTHKVSGRRSKGRCDPHARRGPRCTVTVTAAQTTFKGASGRHRYALRIPRLAPGRYTVTLTARDAAGNTSKPATFTITVKR